MATANWYGNGLLGQYSTTAARRVDWFTDTIKVALLTSSYTPNQDSHTFLSDVNTQELASGGGYTTGGNTLGTKSTSYDPTSNETRLIATSGNVWTFTGTKAFQYGVIYKDTGSAGTSPVLGYINFGAQSVTDTTFTATPDSTGWLKITAA